MDAATLRQRRRMRFGGSGAADNTDPDPVEDSRSTTCQPETSHEQANTLNDDGATPCGAKLTTVEDSAESAQAVAIPSEYECILCLRLYYEPVSLPCGHTYCRGCLKRALNSKPQCPMCRAPCRASAGDSGTNLVVTNIIKAQYGKEYDERGEEAEKDAILEAATRRRAFVLGESVTPAPDGSVSMPVLLLELLVFPHQPVTLYLFEPRYITLVNRCLSDTRRFAVFSDNSPAAGAAGSILEISDARMVGGGHYLLMCRGVGRCTSIGEFEVEEGTRGLRYARVAAFEDDEEAELAAATEAAAARRGDEDGGGAGDAGGVRARSPLTADDVLGVELRELADRTAAAISACMSHLSTRQRLELVRRCDEPPKVGNSSLSSYRKLSFWIPSALAMGGTGQQSARGAAGRRGNSNAATDACNRRAAMFRSRSLKQRLSEACEAVMASDAIAGSTSMCRERGIRRLFCSPGNGGGPGSAGRGGSIMLSSTMSSVLLFFGLVGALYVWHKYSRV